MKTVLVILVAILVLSPVYAQSAPDIIISEIMQNTEDVRDVDGEWVELYNNTGKDVNLNGWILSDNLTDYHVIQNGDPLWIPAGGFIVLCVNEDQTTNGDLPCDYKYTGITLDNNDDSLILSSPSSDEVDRVEYDGGPNFPSPLGASMFFKGPPTGNNNDGSLWETSSSREGRYENDDCALCDDLGSPGAFGSATLPVELAGFSAVLDGRTGILQWETASEENNAGFEIQMASEEGAFERTGWVSGAGTTTEAQSYSYRTGQLAYGNHRFRLKQVDFDGGFEFSEEVTLNVDLDEDHFVEAPYPNPFNPTAIFSFGVQQEQRVTIELFDILGQRQAVIYDAVATANLKHDVRVDGSQLPGGLYLIRIQGQTFEKTARISLIK